MTYECHYCEQETSSVHTVTVYNQEGIEEGLELLCDPCYEDWLHSLKG